SSSWGSTEMGLLDGNYGGGLLDPNTASLLGMAAGMGQASGPSRLPISMGQVMGSGIQGMMSGQRSALESNLLAQEAQKNQLGNAMLAQRYGMMQNAINGTGSFGGAPSPAAGNSGGLLSGNMASPSMISDISQPTNSGNIPGNTMRKALIADALVPGSGKEIISADPAVVGPKAAAEAQAQAPYKAAVALLERAGYVHNIGPNERGVTGFQALEADPVFRQIMGQAG